MTDLDSGYRRNRGGGSFSDVLVVKQTAYGGEISRFVFILYVISTSEEDFVIRERPGVGGGTVSVILLLAVWKQLGLNLASDLRFGFRFMAVE